MGDPLQTKHCAYGVRLGRLPWGTLYKQSNVWCEVRAIAMGDPLQTKHCTYGVRLGRLPWGTPYKQEHIE